MAPKLGELLIKHQVVTPKQLDEALRAQHIFGGRLGTNLVELGYLSEQTLVEFLSAQLKIPAVTLAELDAIKPEVVKLVPAAVAEKYRVIPLSVKDRKMRLAMADALHLKAIDEVKFTSGCAIEPLVAPELLITYGLEKYYGVMRPTRYVRLTGTPSAEFQVVQTSQSMQPPDEALPPVPSTAGAKVLVEQRESFLQLEREDFKPGTYGIKNAAQELAAATRSMDVFQVLKRVAVQDFRRLAIFACRAEQVIGLHQLGCALAEADFRKVAIPIADSELLRRVAESGAPMVCEVPQSKVDNWLFSLLGLSKREVFAVPIKVNSQVVGILLAGDPPRGGLDDHSHLYNLLATKMSYALQMTYLRKRILDE